MSCFIIFEWPMILPAQVSNRPIRTFYFMPLLNRHCWFRDFSQDSGFGIRRHLNSSEERSIWSIHQRRGFKAINIMSPIFHTTSTSLKIFQTRVRKRAQINDSSIVSHCWTSSEACSSRSNDIIDNIVNLGLSWVKTRSLRLIFSSFLRIIFNLFLEKSFQESFNARISTP